MIRSKCKENKEKRYFYFDKSKQMFSSSCNACRYIMGIENKKGVYVKSENRTILENHVKNMDCPQTVTDIKKATMIGETIYSMLSNMVKHGHIERIHTKPYKYKRIDGCDYVFNKMICGNNPRNTIKKEVVLNIDVSDFNEDLELERRVKRWLDEGLSDNEIIMKMRH